MRPGGWPRHRRRTPARLHLAAAAAASVALIPLAYLAVRGAQAGWSRLAAELFTERVAVLTGRSLLLAAVVGAGCLLLGTGSAVLVTRTSLPGRRAFGVLAALPLAVPSYVAAFTWVSVADLWSSAARFEGFAAAAVVLTLYTYPYVYLPVAAVLVRSDPAGEEVARSLGRGPWWTLTSVTLRQARPAIAGGGLLAVLYVLSDFGAVSILRVDTFTRAIFTAFTMGFDRTGAVALSSVLVMITLVILTLEARTRRPRARYAPTGSGARRRPVRLELGRGRLPALVAMTVVAVAALGVPLVSMVRWMGAGVSRPDSLDGVVAAAAGSLGVSLAGAALTMALALPLGLLAARARTRPARILERTAYLSNGLPGVVVGLSLVFFGIHVAYPLYQTTWLLALAYAALFLPLGMTAVAGAAAQSPPVLEEVARSLGQSPRRVLARVTLPLTLPGLGAGTALVVLTCMKELPATLLLRPTGLDTLATELWTHTSVQAYAAAAPYAALLVVLAAVPTWVLAVRSGVVAAPERRWRR